MSTITEKFRIKSQGAARAGDKHALQSPSRAFHQGRATAFQDAADELDAFEQAARALLTACQEAIGEVTYAHERRGLQRVMTASWRLQDAIRNLEKGRSA